MDKIWDAHTVRIEDGGRCVLYIDREYIHEVTSPVAFASLEKRGIEVARPAQITAMPDHNIPTVNQHLPITEPQSRTQVATLEANCRRHGIECFSLGNPNHGIVHIVGPQLGLTQPGMTIVCGDSHTSTHGALGAVAFGIGTTEVEMVLASQCIIQTKPKSMRITIDGKLGRGVEAKDLILYVISKLTAAGGTGYFIEYAGEAIRSLSMEGRMTVCNMSIECGARGGLIAPDQTTFDYLKGRPRAPKGEAWYRAVEQWKTLYSDPDARFDAELHFDAADIQPMITYGTNPGMGMESTGTIPADCDQKALEYMGFASGEKMLGKPVDYVFVGSCTNGRIEDLRRFTELVSGHRKADNITAWIVPGSKEVEAMADNSGVAKYLEHRCAERFGCKVRSIELNVMQRCSAHIASLTDLNEAEQIGAAAVECALNGNSGRMMGFRRISSEPYRIEIVSFDVSETANKEKYFPANWISADKSDVTTDALNYFLPLIQGEVQTEYRNGIPVHFRLNQ